MLYDMITTTLLAVVSAALLLVWYVLLRQVEKNQELDDSLIRCWKQYDIMYKDYNECIDERNMAQEELCYARSRIRELECLIND